MKSFTSSFILTSILAVSCGGRQAGNTDQVVKINGKPYSHKDIAEIGNGSCTGALISLNPPVVLTAGHCLRSMGKSKLRDSNDGEVFSNQWNAYNATFRFPYNGKQGVEPKEISELWIANSPVPVGPLAAANDIGLMLLKSPVASIHTPFGLEDSSPSSGENIVIYGYGNINCNPLSDGVNNNHQLYTANYSWGNMVYFLTCPGDSGSPHIRTATNRIVQVTAGLAVTGETGASVPAFKNKIYNVIYEWQRNKR